MGWRRRRRGGSEVVQSIYAASDNILVQPNAHFYFWSPACFSIRYRVYSRTTSAVQMSAQGSGLAKHEARLDSKLSNLNQVQVASSGRIS